MSDRHPGVPTVNAPSVTARLARLRVPLGFASSAIVLWLAMPTANTIGAGSAVAIAGELLRIWAAGHLNKAREVTTSGPYRWLSHPLYTGSSIMGIGLAIASGSLIVSAVIVAYLALTLTAAIRTEEALLRQRFGDRYDRYKGGRAIAAASDEPRRFRIAQALANREHRTVIGLGLAILLLVLKATYNGTF